MTRPLPLRPSLLERKVVRKPWGGRALAGLFGLGLPAGADVGETWEVFDRPDGSSRMRGDGRTLADWLAKDGEALLGRGVRPARGDRFPLLIKFIDAREALSVQVHPDDAMAARDGDGGKHEGWVVLAAGPRARIVRGLRAGTTATEFAAAVRAGEPEPLLASFAPAVGDAVLVPAGTVHAIGPDVVLYEIQQNSDVTYRLHDWGRDRPLHVEQGLAAMRSDGAVETAVRPVPAGDGSEWLFRTEHFTLRRHTAAEPHTVACEGSFKVVTVLRGRGTIGWRSGGEDLPLPVGPGDTVVVPACVGNVFVSPIGVLTALWAGPGV
jgi:mannose-6-phosphate isomerase